MAGLLLERDFLSSLSASSKSFAVKVRKRRPSQNCQDANMIHRLGGKASNIFCFPFGKRTRDHFFLGTKPGKPKKSKPNHSVIVKLKRIASEH